MVKLKRIFPVTLLHLAMICFWAMKTFSGGISIPMSPLATMIPFDSAMISSILFIPWYKCTWLRIKTPSWKSDQQLRLKWGMLLTKLSSLIPRFFQRWIPDKNVFLQFISCSLSKGQPLTKSGKFPSKIANFNPSGQKKFSWVWFEKSQVNPRSAPYFLSIGSMLGVGSWFYRIYHVMGFL